MMCHLICSCSTNIFACIWYIDFQPIALFGVSCRCNYSLLSSSRFLLLFSRLFFPFSSPFFYSLASSSCSSSSLFSSLLLLLFLIIIFSLFPSLYIVFFFPSFLYSIHFSALFTSQDFWFLYFRHLFCSSRLCSLHLSTLFILDSIL